MSPVDTPKALREYRIYRLTTDGHIESPPDVIECEDDDDAFERARAQLNGNDIEIWLGERRVAVIKAKPT
jgi:hypothetical protein